MIACNYRLQSMLFAKRNTLQYPSYFLLITFLIGGLISSPSWSEVKFIEKMTYVNAYSHANCGDECPIDSSYENEPVTLVSAANINKRYTFGKVNVSTRSCGDVDNAVIKVKKAWGFGNGKGNLYLYPVQRDWNEDTLLYDHTLADTHHPSLTNTEHGPLATVEFTDSNPKNYRFRFADEGIKDLLTAWANSLDTNESSNNITPQPNFGISVRSSSWRGSVGFHSNDADDKDVHPQILATTKASDGTIEQIVITAESMTYVHKGSQEKAEFFAKRKVAEVSANTSWRREAYIKWNDQDIIDAFTGKTIEKAEIILRRSYSYRNFPAVTVELHAVANDWDENITWKTQPSVGFSSNGLDFTGPLASIEYYDSDPRGKVYEFSSPKLTQLVNYWQSISNDQNYGFRLSLKHSNGTIAFHSDDNDDKRSEIPEINLHPSCYQVPSPAPITLKMNPEVDLGEVNRAVFGVGLIGLRFNHPTPWPTPISSSSPTATPPPTAIPTPKVTPIPTEHLSGLQGTSIRVWAHRLKDRNVVNMGYWDQVKTHLEEFASDSNDSVLHINGFFPPKDAPYPAIYEEDGTTNITPHWLTCTGQKDRIKNITNNAGITFTGWEIWNEPQFNKNGGWAADHFGRYVYDCAKEIKRAYPEIKIGIPIHENPAEVEVWNKQLFDTVQHRMIHDEESEGNPIDYIVTHPYDFYWNDAQLNMGSYYSRVSGAEIIRRQKLEPLYDLINAKNPSSSTQEYLYPRRQMIASEWNIHPRRLNSEYVGASRDMAAAIHVANMLGVFMDLDFASAQIFNLYATSTEHFGLFDENDTLYPTGQVLNLFGNYFKGKRIDLDATSNTQNNTASVSDHYRYSHPYDDTVNDNIPFVKSFAAYDEDNKMLTIMLINRHLEHHAEVNINFNNFSFYNNRLMEVFTIGEEKKENKTLPEEDMEVAEFDPLESVININLSENGTAKHLIPAHSVQAIRINGVWESTEE